MGIPLSQTGVVGENMRLSPSGSTTKDELPAGADLHSQSSHEPIVNFNDPALESPMLKNHEAKHVKAAKDGVEINQQHGSLEEKEVSEERKEENKDGDKKKKKRS